VGTVVLALVQALGTAEEKQPSKPVSQEKAEKTPKADGKEKAEPKKEGKPDAKEKAEPKEKWVTLGVFAGKLESVDQAKKSFVLKTGSGRFEQRHTLQAADDVKVRLSYPPVGVDEKGRPKRYSQKELQALRGPDKKLPGYESDFDNLRAGQIVRVTLVQKKEAPARRTYGKKKKDEDELPSDNKPQVSLVLIVVDVPPP
jgi:hypothetical protein